MISRQYLLLLLILISHNSVAQEKPTLFFEPEIELSYNLTSKYSHSFGIENRNFFYKDEAFEFQVKHLELAHTSTFSLSEKQSISIGVQYRFEENFIASEENEFRLLQAFEWQSNSERFNLQQELQTEQRFYASTTKYRLRYELGLEFPLKIGEATNTYIKTEAESLFEIAKTQKPELEQRLSALYGWQYHIKATLEMGLQYRLSDYIQNLCHEVFLITGLEIQL